MEDKTVWSGRPRPLDGEAGASQLPEAERDHAPHPANRKYGLLSRLRSYFVLRSPDLALHGSVRHHFHPLRIFRQ